MSNTKHASTDHPVHALIAGRWSPYAFSDRAVSLDDVRSLFEAARWAPSSYNEQPWRWILAARDQDPEGHAKLLSCLVEGNQGWAKVAPVLVLGVVSTQFSRNGKPNKAAQHDLGLAAGNLSLEATARGLVVHQMIGIEPETARTTFAIPVGFDAFTGLAIGYAGDPATLPEGLAQREAAPRSRKPLTELLHGTGGWDSPSPLA